MSVRFFGSPAILSVILLGLGHGTAWAQQSPYTVNAVASTHDQLTMKVAGTCSWGANDAPLVQVVIKFYKEGSNGSATAVGSPLIKNLTSTGGTSAKLPADVELTPGSAGAYYADVEFYTQDGEHRDTNTTNHVNLVEPAPPDETE